MMDRDWLATKQESAIEPELEIVDPHHHLWDTETVYGRYEVEDLHLDTSAGHNVVQTVFIDCGANYRTTGPDHLRPVGETEYVSRRADRSAEVRAETGTGAVIAAIVGHADLTLGPAVEEVLAAHRDASAGRFRGIRHSGARLDDPAVPVSRTQPPLRLYADPDFRAGAATLAANGFSFEAWQYHPQLTDVQGLAEAVPELPIVINHIGGPAGVGRFAGRRSEVLDHLRAGLEPLAALENVSIKLGGIGMSRYGTDWLPTGEAPGSDLLVDTWGDMLRWCIDRFGPSRCMFESNYPVDGETTGYVVLWNAFKKLSAEYSASERADLFAGTARRFYRLDPLS